LDGEERRLRHDAVAFLAAALMLRESSGTVMAAIQSPCENVCIIEPVAGLCLGCGRSLSEIERWMRYSDAERALIMASLPARLAALSERRPANTQARPIRQG